MKADGNGSSAAAGEALGMALEYAQAGYAIGPVTVRWDAAAGRKDPAFHTAWSEPGGVSADPDQIVAWAREYPGCGWHAPCGPSGFVVAEGDVKRSRDDGAVSIKDGITAWREAGGPRPTMTVRTPSGGEHWYFPAPDPAVSGPIGNSVGTVLPGVDVRGDGGTVFIAGTRVQGHPGEPEAFYSTRAVVPVSELAPLPETWVARLRGASRGGASAARVSGPSMPGLVSAADVHDLEWVRAQYDRWMVRADGLRAHEDFRHELYRVALNLYKCADRGIGTWAEVDDILRGAIRREWGAGPDKEDRDHVAAARREARNRPWVVPATEPRGAGSVDVGGAEGAVVDELGGGGAGLSSSEDDPDVHRAWAPVDMGPYLDGTFTPPAAGLLARTDGVGLFYPGLVHWVYGESESGKSWVCQITVARVLLAGGTALYIDHESDPSAVGDRLVALDVPVPRLLEGLTYVNPDTSSRHEPNTYAELLSRPYDVAVVDGVTMGVNLDQMSSMDNDEVADWIRRIPRQIARKTGAAVLCVDHVTKDKDGRGRFPIGAQAKIMGIDGAGYLVEPETAIRKGAKGEIVLRVAKDRPSGVRPHAGEWRQGDRTQEAARVVLDATDPEHLGVDVRPPAGLGGAGDATSTKFKATVYMERVSRFLQTTEGEVSTKAIESNVNGKAVFIRHALEDLTLLGYVTRHEGPRNSILYRFVKRYTEMVQIAQNEVLPDDDD